VVWGWKFSTGVQGSALVGGGLMVEDPTALIAAFQHTSQHNTLALINYLFTCFRVWTGVQEH